MLHKKTGLDPLQLWQENRRGDRLSPLEQIAELVLPICPNTGGMERFFSLLKLILTSTRSRLTSENLMNSAELNTYVHFEHASAGSLVQRVERQHRQYIDISSVMPPSPIPAEQAASAPSPVGSMPPPPPPSAPPTPVIPTSDGGAGGTNENSGTETAEHSVTLRHVDSLSIIAQRLIADAQRDDDSMETDSEPSTSTAPDKPYKLSLAEAFNYRDDFWVKMVEKWGLRSLDEELEAYGIIDMDAEGDDDPDSYGI